MGSAASTSAKPAKDVLLDKPMIRHERAAVLREIDLQDGARRREFRRFQSPSRTRGPTRF